MSRDPAKLKKYRKAYLERKEHLAHKRGPHGRPEEKRLREGLKGWGMKLRRKRLELGYTQVEFGQIIGINQPSLSNLEKGTYRPSPELKEKIDRLFFRHAGDTGKTKTPPA